MHSVIIPIASKGNDFRFRSKNIRKVMIPMKKILAIVLAAVLCLALAACGGNDTATTTAADTTAADTTVADTTAEETTAEDTTVADTTAAGTTVAE